MVGDMKLPDKFSEVLNLDYDQAVNKSIFGKTPSMRDATTIDPQDFNHHNKPSLDWGGDKTITTHIDLLVTFASAQDMSSETEGNMLTAL